MGLCDTEHRTLAALAAYERAVLSSAGPDAHEHALLLLTVLRKRALSTFAALSRSISRRLGWLGDRQDEDALDWVQPRLGFEEMIDDAAEEERAALTAHTGLDAGRERVFLRQLRGLADEAARRDSKVLRLVELINRTSGTDRCVLRVPRLAGSRGAAASCRTGDRDAARRAGHR